MGAPRDDELPRPPGGAPAPVADFFAGQRLLVTGATGFLGKVLLEKLLWSCSALESVRVLVRPKRGATPARRLEELFRSPVFDRLRERSPELFSKVIAVAGDLTESGLGISDADRKILEDSTTIIIHVAASVRFDDPLKKAVINNLTCVRDILELAKNMKSLKVMTYVSTSYCNCIHQTIEEKVLPAEYDWKTIIKLVETCDDHTLNIIQPKVLNKRPNTYTFTKSLAENVVMEYSKDVPCVIIRPSIVVHTVDEPLEGWIDNLNGPMGLCAGVLTGVLHTLYANDRCIGDYIPCDFATNGIIAATWYKGVVGNDKCEVFNGASGTKKAINMMSVLNAKHMILERSPCATMMWYPSVKVTQSAALFYFLTIFTQILPGLLIDLGLKLKGEKFRLMSVYRKIFIANFALLPFITNEWKIRTEKYDSLAMYMRENDRKVFNYDLSTFDEDRGMVLGCHALKKYILKEDFGEAALKAAAKRVKILYWLHQIASAIFYACALWFTMKFCIYFVPMLIDV